MRHTVGCNRSFEAFLEWYSTLGLTDQYARWGIPLCDLTMNHVLLYRDSVYNFNSTSVKTLIIPNFIFFRFLLQMRRGALLNQWWCVVVAVGVNRISDGNFRTHKGQKHTKPYSQAPLYTRLSSIPGLKALHHSLWANYNKHRLWL